MDRRDKELDYSNMDAIPTYALYGENEDSGESWLHWETITSRSRLHGFRISPHRHDQLYQILYIRDGVASVMLDGDTLEITPPALVIVPPLTVHSFVFSEGVDGFVLTFYIQDVRNALADIGTALDGLMQPSILRPVSGIVDASELDHAVGRLIAEADHSAPGQLAALHARLSLLLVAAHRLDLAAAQSENGGSGPADRHAQAFLGLVDMHFRDTRKVGYYAGRLGITPTHLNRVCRQVLGLSALTIIERRILLEARRYLQFSNLSIKEIGIVLGYADPAYFSRFMTRRLGRGPQAVRDGFMRRDHG
ncbi:helix-turn-helix domain-containing protein [Pelagibacterium sp.]|uniref:helix-turn-helix domain-containing protein n=1 Tax=Pelagibacterium sp. TaxID=1967288 RepID=UPI003A905984